MASGSSRTGMRLSPRYRARLCLLLVSHGVSRWMVWLEIDRPAAWSIDQILKDVGAMMEELLVKTLPPPEEEKKVVTGPSTKK